MALKINNVAGEILRAAAKEMVEADFIKRRRRGKRGDVTAETVMSCELALTTIAMAFQRMKLLMRTSVCQSPGYFGSFSTGMVLT